MARAPARRKSQPLTDMPDAPAQARRFGKTRAERSAALLEDYVELIADLFAANGEARAADVARRIGVTHPTALKNIARLRREGLVTSRPYRGLFLTEAGQRLADAARARHRVVVDFLVAVGAPREAAEADAEGMEHHVSRSTLRAFERFLAERSEG
ncbi:MAG TPA: manganese-binding transcriptional regulator MntR [Roseiarcus sp.]|nr:manganese-binding transcriptional regulator MntR [Roseiarcus sp.]